MPSPHSPFTFVGTANASDNGALPAVTLNGVTAGNLIVLWCKWEGGGSITSVSDGTDNLTADPLGARSQEAGDLKGEFFFLLAAGSSGNKTYTPTTSGTIAYGRVVVMEFSHTGTAAYRDSGALGGNNETYDIGTPITVDSGTATSESSTHGLAIGGYSGYDALNWTTPLFNGASGVATFGPTQPDSIANSYKLFTGGFSTGISRVTMSHTASWVNNLILFAATPPTGGNKKGQFDPELVLKGWF